MGEPTKEVLDKLIEHAKNFSILDYQVIKREIFCRYGHNMGLGKVDTLEGICSTCKRLTEEYLRKNI